MWGRRCVSHTLMEGYNSPWMTQVDSTWVAPPLTAGPREDGCIGISKSSPSLRTFLPLLSQIQHVGPVSLSIIIIFSPWRSHVRRRGWVSVRRWRQYSHDVLADGGFDEGVCFSLGDISGRNLNQFCPPDVVVSACEPMAVEGSKSCRYMPTCTRPRCYLCSPYTMPASQEKIQHIPAKPRIYCGGLRNAVRCLVDSYATFCLSLCMLRKVNIPVLTSYSSHAIR